MSFFDIEKAFIDLDDELPPRPQVSLATPPVVPEIRLVVVQEAASEVVPEAVPEVVPVAPENAPPIAPESTESAAEQQRRLQLRDLADLLDGEWAILPIKADSDKPDCDNWASLELTPANVGDYFSDGGNIAFLLGRRSEGLTALRFGGAVAAEVGEAFAPLCGSRISAEGEEYSSCLLYHTELAWAEPPIDKIEFVDPIDSETLVEISVGAGEPAYVVAPPSIVDGVQLRWAQEDHALYAPTEVSGGVLRDRARLIAFTSLLAKRWPRDNKIKEAMKVAEATGAAVSVAKAEVTRLTKKPAQALALAMAAGATEEDTTAARAAYERADAALISARNNVQQLRTELAEAERTAKLLREASARAASAAEYERRRDRYAKALKKATAAMQELADAYLDTPAGVFEELTGPSGQILAGPYAIDKLHDALIGGAPQDLVAAYGRRARRLVDGSVDSPSIGTTLLERQIANGTRRAA